MGEEMTDNARNKRYRQWIIDRNIDYDEAYGNCQELCVEMMEAFPMLTMVRGHYYCSVWGERGHWWLKTDDGEILDPSAVQFPTKGNGVYVEWDESAAEPTGTCPNCGEYCYDGEQVHERCYEEFKASLY